MKTKIFTLVRFIHNYHGISQSNNKPYFSVRSFSNLLTIFSFVFFILLCPQIAQAQNKPVIQAKKCFGGTDVEDAHCIQQTTDGGYIIAGYAYSDDGDVSGNHGANDYWIIKFSRAGSIQWQKSLGGTNGDFASSIQQTNDGGYVVAGGSSSNDGDVSGNHGDYDFWIVKLSSAGSIQWQKSLGGTSFDIASSIEQTQDSGYIVAGTSYSNNGDVSGHHGAPDAADCWIVKLNVAGSIQWQKSFGGSMDDNANSIKQTKDGGYIFAGNSFSNDGNVSGHHGSASLDDYWVVKLTASGNIKWQKSLGGTNGDAAISIYQNLDKSYIVAGSSSSNDGDVSGNHGGNDYWIVKLNAAGNINWQKSLGGTDGDGATSIQQAKDSGYIVVGGSSSNNGNVSGHHGTSSFQDYWIVKLNTVGNIQWQKSLGGANDDIAFSVQQTADGGYLVAGDAASNDGDVKGNHGGYDDWIVKLSASGNPITSETIFSSAQTEKNINPFDLHVQPNPVHLLLHIENLNTKESYKLIIKNEDGIIVKQASTNNISSYDFDVSQFASGTYFIKFIAADGSTQVVKKFIKQ